MTKRRKAPLPFAIVAAAIAVSGVARADPREDEIARADALLAANKAAEAAPLYAQIWTTYGSAACEKGEPACAPMGEVLLRGARAYQAAGQIPEAKALRNALLDPRYRQDRTEHAAAARFEQAEMFLAIAELDEAASWYEAFAFSVPKDDRAPGALQNARALRLALGQDEAASRDASHFFKFYGTKRAREAAELELAIATESLDRGDLAEAKRRLVSSVRTIDRHAFVGLGIEAHAALGRAFEALGEKASAAKEYQRVEASFEDPAFAASIEEESDGGSTRKLGRALTAVGEARFFFAEQKRAAAAAIAPPKGASAADPKALADWIRKRSAAVDAAERAYLEVLNIRPVPPPKWVVKAASRVAFMQGELAEQIRKLPLSKSLPKTAEARDAYRKGLLEASVPFYNKARAAYRMCVDLGAKYQYGDDDSRACAASLSQRDPKAFPRVDEIIFAPTRASDGMLPSAPLPEPP